MLLAACLAFFAFSGAPGDVLGDRALHKKVTFSTRAADATTVITGLGRAAGVKLVVAPIMRQEILVLKLDGAALSDAMKRIATAAGGSWTKDRDIFILGRSDADEQRRKVAANTAERPDIVAFINEAKDHLAVSQEFDAIGAATLAGVLKNDVFIPHDGGSYGINNKALAVVSSKEPMGRLMNSISSQLDPDLVLDAPFGLRTVYSTNANTLERPLPFDAGRDIAVFLRTENLWADAVIAAKAMPNIIMEGNFVGRIDTQVVKLDVVVDRSRQLPEDSLVIELVGQDGAILASCRRTLSHPAQMAGHNVMIDKAEKELTISADERTEILRLLNGSGLQVGPVPLSDDLRHGLEHPDQFEPMGSFVSSILLQTAEGKSKNLVADVPDTWLQVGAESLGTAEKGTHWIEVVSARTSTACPDDPHWIEIDGGARAEQAPEEKRADRKLLATMLGSGKAGVFSAEMLGKYAFDSGEINADALFLARLGNTWITDPDTRQFLQPVSGTPGSPNRIRRGMVALGNDQWNVLRVLGALAELQGTAQVAAQQLNFGTLDQGLDTVVKDILFFEGGPLRDAKMGPDGRLRMASYEPFDLFPQGLPKDGLLDFDVSSESTVVSDGANPMAVSASQLARNSYNTTHHPERAVNGPTITSKFRLGSQRQLSVQLKLLPGVGWQNSYLDPEPVTGDAVSFDLLPANFVRQVKSTMSYLERSSPPTGPPPVGGARSGP